MEPYGKINTMNDALDTLGSLDISKLRPDARWRALAIFLRELALAQGLDLNCPIEEPSK